VHYEPAGGVRGERRSLRGSIETSKAQYYEKGGWQEFPAWPVRAINAKELPSEEPCKSAGIIGRTQIGVGQGEPRDPFTRSVEFGIVNAAGEFCAPTRELELRKCA